MSSRPKQSLADNVAQIFFLGLIAMAVVVSAAQWMYQWALAHWYISLPALGAVLAVIVLLLSGMAQDRRDARERLALLRYGLDEIDAMTPSGFELACRDLMRRDGLRADHVGRANDKAADVTGTDQSGRVVIVQCKHTIRAAKVGVGVVYTVNGTARPVHRADLAVIITNGGFTRPAREFAAEHGVHLIDRDRLRLWAGNGRSIHQVLGIAV